MRNIGLALLAGVAIVIFSAWLDSQASREEREAIGVMKFYSVGQDSLREIGAKSVFTDTVYERPQSPVEGNWSSGQFERHDTKNYNIRLCRAKFEWVILAWPKKFGEKTERTFAMFREGELWVQINRSWSGENGPDPLDFFLPGSWEADKTHWQRFD